MTRALRVALAFVVGGAIAAPAFAVPISPFNTRPVVLGSTFPGEIPLQTMVDTILGPGQNVASDQSPAAVWATATGGASTIPTLMFEQTSGATSQVFGIWFGTDTSSIYTVDLLLGAAVGAPLGGTNAAISWSGPGGTTLNVGSSVIADCGPRVNCGSFTNGLVTPNWFGFYLRTPGAIFYSSDLLNGGTARMVAYDQATNWAIAFEDGSDFDYNDMVVKVESIAPVPEPGTLLLIGSGLAGLAARRRCRS